MTQLSRSIIALAIALAVSTLSAMALTLPDIVGSNMVLQQNSQAALWGWAKPGATVTVTTGWNRKSYKAVAAPETGRWDVKVSTPTASFTPHTITIKEQGQPGVETLDNVLIGEVWLASGQSNMEMPLKGFFASPVEGSNQAIAEAGRYRHAIRFATVPRVRSDEPQPSAPGKWVESTPTNAPDFSAVAYFFARQLVDIINVPVGIIHTSWGGSTVEGWMPRSILKSYADVDMTGEAYKTQADYMHPWIMYNAMLYPLAGYTLKGFLWNQGESNLWRHNDYPTRLAAMVAHWRELWQQPDAPFYCVEVPPYAYGGEQATEGAFLREAQRKAVDIIPNSGIVSCIDLVRPGTSRQIHPSRKLEIGRRLAYMAAHRDYGHEGIACDSPTYREARFDGGKAVVTIDNIAEGLLAEGGEMEGFELAGPDGVFHPAVTRMAFGRAGTGIEVSSPEVTEAKAVRYCFRNWQPGNVYNTRQLPLAPFRTDSFAE